MTQYIGKADVVAEIERRKEYYENIQMIKPVYESNIEDFNELLSFLDSIKVKEIDLEDSIKESLAQKYIDYTFKRHNIDPESREGQLIYYAYMHGMNQCLNQLKAQKGE